MPPSVAGGAVRFYDVRDAQPARLVLDLLLVELGHVVGDFDVAALLDVGETEDAGEGCGQRSASVSGT